jgi:hypothetical protein
MAGWPRTLSGKLFTFVLAVAAVPLVVLIAKASAVVWVILAVVAFGCLALVVWRRRVEATRERARGSFTFGDAVRRKRAKDALELSAARRSHASHGRAAVA